MTSKKETFEAIEHHISASTAALDKAKQLAETPGRRHFAPQSHAEAAAHATTALALLLREILAIAMARGPLPVSDPDPAPPATKPVGAKPKPATPRKKTSARRTAKKV